VGPEARAGAGEDDADECDGGAERHDGPESDWGAGRRGGLWAALVAIQSLISTAATLETVAIFASGEWWRGCTSAAPQRWQGPNSAGH
jgi:hypothetical protein